MAKNGKAFPNTLMKDWRRLLANLTLTKKKKVAKNGEICVNTLKKDWKAGTNSQEKKIAVVGNLYTTYTRALTFRNLFQIASSRTS